MNRKIWAILGIFTVIFGGIYYFSRPVTLKLGIFAGSNWNVPQPETYAIIDDVIADFEAENPGIRVIYVSGIKKEDYSEWLAEKFVDGDEPDVFFLLADDFNLYATTGALMNLNDFIFRDKSFSSDVYYPAALNFGRYEENLLALPFECTITFMFVNKTLLAKENIDIPRNDWTWKDFLEICRKVTRDTDGDGIIDQFGCYDYTWRQTTVANGLKLFRDDGKTSYFADSRMEAALKFLIELHAINGGREVTPKDFDLGRVAFRPFTLAEYRTYKPYPWRIKKYSSFEWDCIQRPAGTSGKSTSVLDSLLIGMSSRTNHANLAWKLMKKFCFDVKTQRDILKRSPALPVRRDIIISAEAQEIFSWEANDTAMMTPADISDAMDAAVMPYKFKNYDAAMRFADAEINKIITGVVPFNNALNKLQKEVNAFLQY